MTLSTAGKIGDINTKTLSGYLMNTTISDFGKDKTIHGGQGIYEDVARKGYCSWNNLLIGKLCIDEKDIQGQVYTILTNAEKNQLIAMFPGTRTKDVVDFLNVRTTQDRRASIQEVCCDMSHAMEKTLTTLFPNAKLVTDRFHVMKNLLDDIGAIRTRCKTAIKKKLNELQQAYILKLEDEAKKLHGKYTKRGRPKIILPYKKMRNGESEIDLVTRIIWQIRKRKKDWNPNQVLRWEIARDMFELKDLVEGYEYLHKLWDIYDEKLSVEVAKQKINQWLVDGSEIRKRIIEVSNLMSTIERHFDTICNYFESRHSNGYAEGLHSRIQRLISMSRGFVNKDYMIYRIIKLCHNGSINSTGF